MSKPLPADYLADVERRCRRFQGTWDQGTSGSLAADAFRLLRERKTLMGTISELERANHELRAAVEGRLAVAEAACCEGAPLCQTIDTRGPLADPDREIAEDDELLEDAPRCVAAMDEGAMAAAWDAIKEKHNAMHERIKEPRVFATPASAEVTPAERLLQTAIATIRDRRGTYGPPRDHFAITIGLLNAAFAERIRRRLAAGAPPFALDDWPIIMTLDKIARDTGGPRQSADTPIDLAGYAATLAECRTA